MRFDILSVFPEMFHSVINCSIQKRACDAGIISYHLHDIRKYSLAKHKNTDDYPFGGGNGMVMTPQPIFDCIRDVCTQDAEKKPYCIVMSPRGRMLTTDVARELAKKERLLILCGHYEGIDERVYELMDDEISTGDYVLTGGELPALTLCDCVSRFIPGVLGTGESAEDESFSVFGGLLEYPQYTRPADLDGRRVPEVLLGGNHAEIEAWRRREAVIKTAKQRPDLIARANLTPEEICLAHRYMHKFKNSVVKRICVNEKRTLCIYTDDDCHDINAHSGNVHFHHTGYLFATGCRKHIDSYKAVVISVQNAYKTVLNITDETQVCGLKPSEEAKIRAWDAAMRVL